MSVLISRRQYPATNFPGKGLREFPQSVDTNRLVASPTERLSRTSKHIITVILNLVNTLEKNFKGIYNSRGWSVLEGSQNNEWTFSQEHPESYRQWLEHVNQN